MNDSLIQFDISALACGYATYVLTYSKIAEPLRKLIWRLSDDIAIDRVSKFFLHRSVLRRRVNKFFSHIHNGIRCPYCTSFWVALACQFVVGIDMFYLGWRGIFLTTLAMLLGPLAVGITALGMYIDRRNHDV